MEHRITTFTTLLFSIVLLFQSFAQDQNDSLKDLDLLVESIRKVDSISRDSLYKELENKPTDLNQAMFNHAKGIELFLQGKSEEGKQYYKKASQLYQKLGLEKKALATMNNIAVCYYYQDSLYKAFEIHKKVYTPTQENQKS